MTEQEKKEIIEENIGIEELIQYLTGDYGQRLCMDADGKSYLLEKGTYAIDPEEREVTSVDCIGIGNFDDIEFFSIGWTNFDNEMGMYEVIETKEIIDLEEMITRSCREGYVDEYLENLRKNLLKNWE